MKERAVEEGAAEALMLAARRAELRPQRVCAVWGGWSVGAARAECTHIGTLARHLAFELKPRRRK